MKVLLIAAITADGFIARSSEHLADWTSKEDKKLFVELTNKAGVIVMGRKTYDTIGHPLPGRLNIVYTSGSIDNENVETTQESPTDLVKRLAEDGFNQIAICGGQSIYELFLQSGAVDELYLTIEPRIFGSGITLASSFFDIDLKLIDLNKLNDDTLNLHYQVVK